MIINAERLSIGHGRRKVAEGISFSAGEGECILLCGANGSGKSTLLKTIAGLLRPLDGKIELSGKAVMIPTGIPRVKGFSMEEFILTGCRTAIDLWGRRNPEAEMRLTDTAAALGISGLLKRDISEVSDGEFQKACIASALICGASAVLLDEPTAFLDVDGRAAVLEVLRNLAGKDGICVLFSSHDINESAALSTRILGFGADGKFHDSRSCTKEEVLSACFKSLRPVSPGKPLLPL